jgi:hypothetical protein
MDHSSSSTTSGNGYTRQAAGAACPVNVNDLERQISLLGGGALLAAGILRGRVSGVVMALAGAGFVYRGATGHCLMYQFLGVSTCAEQNCGEESAAKPSRASAEDLQQMQQRVGNEGREALDLDDPVEQASFDSFPASDPPSWITRTRAKGRR